MTKPATQITRPAPGSTCRLTVTLTTEQWLAVEGLNDIWLYATSAYITPSEASIDELTCYKPAHRTTSQPILAAALWVAAHPAHIQSRLARTEDATYYAAVGPDPVQWAEDGRHVMVPGVPGALPVLAATSAPGSGVRSPAAASTQWLWACIHPLPAPLGGRVCMDLWLWPMEL